MITTAAVSAGLALGLGLRHALDADHLAAVDGLTRWNAGKSQPVARYCGALFAAGHCAVLIMASLTFASLRGHFTPPAWLATAGAVVAALLLIAFSMLNLHNIMASHPARRLKADRSIAMGGMRTRLLGALLQDPRPWQIGLVGALFAISFDTAGIAVVFAASPLGTGSEGAALIQTGYLAAAFSAGMFMVTAANGMWVARLLEHSKLNGVDASRVMGTTIALAGLLVGCSALLPLFSTTVEQWLDAHEFAASLLVFTALIAGYSVALLVTSHDRLSRQVPTTN